MNKKLKCTVCHHNCELLPSAMGFCGVRQNIDGKIVNRSYGLISSIALDPIEKKPLYQYFPGSSILSVGSFGCNMACDFCQNYHIAQKRLPKCDTESGERFTPLELVELAVRTKHRGNIGIAFTYNEPLINYEFIIDCGKIIKKTNADLKLILVTNGHLNEEYAQKIYPFVDAMNIDLKFFNESFYKKMGGNFSLVKNFISEAVKHCHVELTYLLIPHLNDTAEEVEAMASWVASLDCKGTSPIKSGKEIPLHISRFFPTYKLTDRAPTSIASVYAAVDLAKKYLHRVYPGNVPF
ncbi:MAG: AmmeMemoRadiSam system radical SAM enzyme [Treponemataceae bacterium]